MDYIQRIEVEGVILRLDEQNGALVVYAKEEMRGETVDATLKDSSSVLAKTLAGYKANIVGRRVNSDFVFAAVFPRLPPGFYTVIAPFEISEITVFPGETAEIDWR